MRFTHFFAGQAGPLAPGRSGLFSLDLTDEGAAAPHILLSGPSGSGKTTVLRALAQLWGGLGRLLFHPEADAPQGFNCALSVEGLLPGRQVRLFMERESGFLASLPPAQGPELGYRATGKPMADAGALAALRGLAEAGGLPNLVLVDTDALPEPPGPALPAGFLVTDECFAGAFLRDPGAGLAQLYAQDPAGFEEMAQLYAELLPGKRLTLTPPHPRVVLPSGASHPLSGLSRGERAALLMLYTASAQLRPGGALLLDHPDVHLHPEQVDGVLGALELLVDGRAGQLLITSHRPEVWERYERLGVRVRMEGV